MGDDPGGGVGQRFVEVHGGTALVENRVDELVRDEGVGAFVAALMAEGLGEEIGFPPFGHGEVFEGGEGAFEAAAVFFGLPARADEDGAEAVGFLVQVKNAIEKPERLLLGV